MPSGKSHTGRRESLVGRKDWPFHRIWISVSFDFDSNQSSKQYRPIGLFELRRRWRGAVALNQVGNRELTRTVGHKVSESGLAHGVEEGSRSLPVRMMVEMK